MKSRYIRCLILPSLSGHNSWALGKGSRVPTGPARHGSLLCQGEATRDGVGEATLCKVACGEASKVALDEVARDKAGKAVLGEAAHSEAILSEVARGEASEAASIKIHTRMSMW